MIKIIITNLDGDTITDPERAIDYATGIQIETAWPKGYMTASFQCRRSDVFADWVVHESYGCIIYDDATIVFDGRIEAIQRTAGGVDEYCTVLCVGWYVVLEERDTQKRWIDVKGVTNLEWPAGSESSGTQNSFVTNYRDNIIQVFIGSKDNHRVYGDNYRERYTAISGTVRRVRYNYTGRCGESLLLSLNNLTSNASESQVYINTGFVQNGTVNVTLATATPAFDLVWTINKTDLYDQSDYIHVYNLRVEANYETGHRYYSSPTYTQGQLIEDCILLSNLKGAQLSTNFEYLGDPGFILDPFTVEEPRYLSDVIQTIAGYGDSSLNTWGLCVWDRSDTTDNKPRVVFEVRDDSDYEYVVNLFADELAGLTYERTSDGLHNNVTVSYNDTKNRLKFRTSANNSALADTTSIANEYRRDYYIKLGDGDTTRADYVGQRYIQYHKDRKTKGGFTIKGKVTLKGGGYAPASHVRAGQRIKLLNTDEILFIRSTSYDAESQTVRISPDVPEDNIAMLFVQRERGFGRLA